MMLVNIYLPLLEIPLKSGDLTHLDEMIDLIRSDYGRRAAKADAPAEAIRANVSRLKELRKKAAADESVAAFAIYRDLIANQ